MTRYAQVFMDRLTACVEVEEVRRGVHSLRIRAHRDVFGALRTGIPFPHRKRRAGPVSCAIEPALDPTTRPDPSGNRSSTTVALSIDERRRMAVNAVRSFLP